MTEDGEEFTDTPSSADDVYVPVGLRGIMSATTKLLHMSRGLSGEDVRDGVQFKRILTPSALISERVRMDNGGVVRNIMRHAARHRSLKGFMPSALDGLTEHYVTSNGQLVSPIEEINPIDILGQSRRVTAMGPGGVGSKDSITENMQCHDEATEVFTKEGWKAWTTVTLSDLLACRVHGRMEFHCPQHLTAQYYEGPMYCAKGRSVNYMVTPNHRFFSASTQKKKIWDWITADKHHARYMSHLATSLPYEGSDASDVFALPEAEKILRGNTLKSFPTINMGDWCEFMGWFLSEGSVYNGEGGNRYSVIITQSPTANPTKWLKINELFKRLPFTFDVKGKNFRVKSKALYAYMQQFGKSGQKFIPDFLFEVRSEYRRRFLDAFCAGDGHTTSSGNKLYSSSSAQLADGLERLLILAGRSTSRGTPWSGKKRNKEHSCWMQRVNELTRETRTTAPKNQSVENFKGMVYCATVPGSFLLTRRGGIPFWNGNSVHGSQFGFFSTVEGPESEAAGIDVRLSHGVKIGDNGRPYQKFRNKRTGNFHWLSPEDLIGKTVGLPRPDSMSPAVS